MRFWGSVVVWFCAFLSCSTASAQEERPEVREGRSRYTIGVQHYEAGDYALALEEFRRSYELLRSVAHPNTALELMNIARCYVRLRRDREAIATYRQFLDDAPPDAASEIADARAELRELEARQALDGGGGEISPIGPIVAAIGAAAVIAAAITGGLALAANEDAEDGCVERVCPPENEARNEEAQTLANATDGLLIAGGVFAVTGIILIFVLPAESSAPRVSAGCTDQGCAMSVRGRF